ncbi:MAG TPA: zinc finger domain-containing protein, partial [Vampirovibrionales bacterium]
DDETDLRFKDLRAFGRMSISPSLEEAYKQDAIAALAPEPLDEKNFTLKYFTNSLKKYTSNIKGLLLDQQKVVSGVGNIYADESLFLAGIQPTREANKIKPKEAEKLYKSIKTVIANSIEAGGTSIRDYVQTTGEFGNYALELFVYGRKKQSCLVCESPITYTRIAQRGTHFCPKCQL